MREQSKEIYCSWEANPPLLTSIRASIFQKGQVDSIEEKRVRRPEVLFAGHDLSFGNNYTISVGSLETSVNLAGSFPLAFVFLIERPVSH